MARLEDLIKDIDDPRLRGQIAGEVAKLKVKKKFGLVFEEHLPEVMELPGLAVKPGARVTKRGDKAAGFFLVKTGVNGTKVRIVPERGGPEEIAAKDDWVVVKRFGEPIYPALIPLERITRVPGKPYHTVINSDNFHALQVLLYCYEGQVDVIYIDPPYNSGARDWKYNNDYVDASDQYRHSKWLSMMKRRLDLAKRLLKPDGVLIVTIDENEVAHLAMLLEQLFPEARRQMVTIVNNAAGVSQGGLWRVEEYAFFCWRGNARPVPVSDDLLSDESKLKKMVLWFSLVRAGGVNATPTRRPGLVFPIAIDPATNRIVAIGRTLKERVSAGEVSGNLNNWRPDAKETLDGLPVVWPFNQDGSLYTWQMKPEAVLSAAGKGFVRVKRYDGAGGNRWSINYIRAGHQKRILSGAIPNHGREENNGPYLLGDADRFVVPKTVWKRTRHDAGKWGSRTLRELLGDVSFDYAKSPYAVLDSLRTVAGNMPNALVLDFFAGSGTTLHALAMLNAEDNGARRCILVTNNQVDDLATKFLNHEGHIAGDEEFEAHGICHSVTMPRIRAALTGRRNEKPIPGEYQGGRMVADGFEENAQFLKLDFLDPAEVKRGETYEAILPILWMMAGASGDLELSKGSGKYHFPRGCPLCVLLREDHFKEFAAKLAERPDITHVFLVTDSVEAFHEMASRIGRDRRCVQLYKSYLDNFKINLEPKHAD